MKIRDPGRFGPALTRLRGEKSYHSLSLDLYSRTDGYLELDPSTCHRWATGKTERINALGSFEDARLFVVSLMNSSAEEGQDLDSIIDSGFELLAGLLGEDIAKFAMGELHHNLTRIRSADVRRAILEECLIRWLPDMNEENAG